MSVLRTRARKITVSLAALAALSSGALLINAEAGQAAPSSAQSPAVKYNGSAWVGVRVTAAGKVVNSFNTFGGGNPRITHPSTGVYDIYFRKAPIKDGNSILLVTPDTPSADCTATSADYADRGKHVVVVVETKDCTNVFADRGFHLVVFG
jgi:hypothetical protein